MENSADRHWRKVLWATAACVVGGAVIATHLYERKRLREKPQRRFRAVFADNTDEPFQHLPLPSGDAAGEQDYPLHPYVHDVLTLKDSLAESTPQKPPLNSEEIVGCYWIDKSNQLRNVVAELQGLSVFALDTEYHKQRSYHGFICLIQIFTGQRIYLIDAVALHDDLPILNTVFADPKIRKVVHGGHNDVIWLQKDFKAYLINIFDTEKACHALQKRKSNLAYLLDTYFDVTTDKSMQRADWRERPLSDAQIKYAQLDVRYLLDLEFLLKEEMLENKSSLTAAVQKSHDLSLSLFQKMTSEQAATTAALQILRRYFEIAGKSSVQGDYDLSQEKKFMSGVHRICVWRDEVAREEDESPEFILKTKLISVLSRSLPDTIEDLLDCVLNTPMYDYSGSYDNPEYWDPPEAFLKRAQELAKTIEEVKSGQYEWTKGPELLDPVNHKLKTKNLSGNEKEKKIEIFAAKHKVYDNCKMLSVDGELLCYCDRRNLEWYVKKKIAKVESEDPLVIRLLFQHRTSDEANKCHDFYVQSRANRCVSCGEDGHYLRYKIVPACYRKNFPVALKSHRSHDIVLLCIDCHEIAQAAQDKLKRKLSEEYQIPLNFPLLDSEERIKLNPLKVRAAAKALENSRDRIPPSRLEQLETTIHLYFGRDPKKHGEITPEDLKIAQLVGLNKREMKKTISRDDKGQGLEVRLSSLPKKCLDTGEARHGKLLVEKAMSNGGEAELYSITRRFREAFVEALNPKYLPKKWDIDHFAPRQFGEHSVFYEEDTPSCN